VGGCPVPPPAALVVTAGFDPLRDEGEAYARVLAAAKNRVMSWREPSLMHGFINMVGVSPSARQAVQRIGVSLRKMLDEVATVAPQRSEAEAPSLAS
jgi:acetyl esterase